MFYALSVKKGRYLLRALKVAKQWQNSFYAIKRNICKSFIMSMHRVGIEPTTQ
jgi:hypothetical protein